MDPNQTPQVSRAGDYAEDALGFGGTEWRTARDLVVRPRAVLDAYLKFGSTGGGHYARPIRFYLALCGVLMFYLFLVGGADQYMEMMPPAMLDDLIGRSGKTREAFMDDADGWLSLVLVPVTIPFYAVAVAPVLKWSTGWTWRLSFRATFALLCAWTVPMLPLGPLPYLDGLMLPAQLFIWGALAVQFVRMGRGRWWRRKRDAAGKLALIFVTMSILLMVGLLPVLGIGALGGMYGS